MAQTPRGEHTILAEAIQCKLGFPSNLTTDNSEMIVRRSNLALPGAILGQAQQSKVCISPLGGLNGHKKHKNHIIVALPAH